MTANHILKKNCKFTSLYGGSDVKPNTRNATQLNAGDTLAIVDYPYL